MGCPAIVATDIVKEFSVSRDRARHIKALAVQLFRRKRPTRERFRAIDGVSFTVERGCSLGVIGENGSGKSTLLGILSRILRPTSGTFELQGRVCTLLELGAGFHPELTGAENVYLNGIILGLTRRQVAERLDSILEFSELEAFADVEVRAYSSGMVTRLGFAVAIHADPDVLLLDEGLSVGDERFGLKCQATLADFRSGGSRAMVMVSHDLGAVRRLCDRVLWLHRGKVRVLGETSEVLDQYGEFVRGGMGNPET